MGVSECQCPLTDAQVRDAVAVIQYLLWLEKAVPRGEVDEFSGAQRMDALRRSVLLPRSPLPGVRHPGTCSTTLPATFQSTGTQPWAQLPVHLRQRAQCRPGTLQVPGLTAAAWWGQLEQSALIHFPSQPLQRKQPAALCG